MLRRINLANVLPGYVIHIVLKIYNEDAKFAKRCSKKNKKVIIAARIKHLLNQIKDSFFKNH